MKLTKKNHTDEKLLPTVPVKSNSDFEAIPQTFKKRLIIFIIGLIVLYFVIVALGSRNQILSSVGAVFIMILVIIGQAYLIIFIFIPIIVILIKIWIKTKNWHYAFQVFVHIQLALLWVLCEILYLWMRFGEDPKYSNFLFEIMDKIAISETLSPLLFYILFYVPFIILVEYYTVRQPIFIDFTKSRLSNADSTLISSGARKIDNVEDGFSQRAIYSDFKILKELVDSKQEFLTFGQNYARFLAKKGVIIDWELTQDTITLYPRFVIRYPSLIYNPLDIVNLLKSVWKRTNLTKIVIDYVNSQILIRISFRDYNILAREVTFHSLGLDILHRLKQSILAFLDNNLGESYEILF